MNILVLGSGGREHALAWKISQSPLTSALYVSPGNAGTAALAKNISLFEGDFDQPAFERIGDFARSHQITLVVVGPEAPLVAGIKDYFDSQPSLAHVTVVGPNQAGALLEGSKDFAKDFMQRHHIPTARAKTFTRGQLQDGLQYIDQQALPVVLKADGLAAGKGVVICQTHAEAHTQLREMLEAHKFGAASEKVVIEDFLQGIELSVFVLTDGKSYKILPEAKDYKRIGEGDTGLNTGGMGAVSPVPFADKVFMEKVTRQVIEPTIHGLAADGIDYRGFIFIGLMNVAGEPFVIEYNVRLGDPEAEAIIPRIQSDLLPLLEAVGRQQLDQHSLTVSPQAAATVVMVAEGYPESYARGEEIQGLNVSREELVFHGGTRVADHRVLTHGGRVLAVTGMGRHLEEALHNSYRQVETIRWNGCYFRRDIGQDLLAW